MHPQVALKTPRKTQDPSFPNKILTKKLISNHEVKSIKNCRR